MKPVTTAPARLARTALRHPGQPSCNTEPMARIRDILGGLTCAAGAAAVLIAIVGTVSAHGTQAVRGVAASESAAADQAAARTDTQVVSPAAVPAEEIGEGRVRNPRRAISSRTSKITRQAAADGKPNSGFVSYFRLNRALPFAPRRKFEGEEEGGPRLFAAYLSVDRVHEEGATETMGDEYEQALLHRSDRSPRARTSASHWGTCECVPRRTGSKHDYGSRSCPYS